MLNHPILLTYNSHFASFHFFLTASIAAAAEVAQRLQVVSLVTGVTIGIWTRTCHAKQWPTLSLTRNSPKKQVPYDEEPGRPFSDTKCLLLYMVLLPSQIQYFNLKKHEN